VILTLAPGRTVSKAVDVSAEPALTSGHAASAGSRL
jgi:hypothetical protein